MIIPLNPRQINNTVISRSIPIFILGFIYAVLSLLTQIQPQTVYPFHNRILRIAAIESASFQPCYTTGRLFQIGRAGTNTTTSRSTEFLNFLRYTSSIIWDFNAFNLYFVDTTNDYSIFVATLPEKMVL